MAEKFTVGLIQMHCSADPDDNLRRAVEKVRAAAKQGAQMVCLPELFQTRIRSTASGLVFNLARLISFPLPILTASLFSALGGYRPTILLLTLLYVIAIAALATLPETKGRPLPN